MQSGSEGVAESNGKGVNVLSCGEVLFVFVCVGGGGCLWFEWCLVCVCV